MGRSKAARLPPDAAKVRRRIDTWRRTREKRTRMPEELWRGAVELAQIHGVHAMSRGLRVRYESLKQRVVEAEAATAGPNREREGDAELVELTPAWVGAGVPAQCIVELHEPGGARMRIRLPDAGAIDVAAFAEAFWNRRR